MYKRKWDINEPCHSWEAKVESGFFDNILETFKKTLLINIVTKNHRGARHHSIGDQVNLNSIKMESIQHMIVLVIPNFAMKLKSTLSF